MQLSVGSRVWLLHVSVEIVNGDNGSINSMLPIFRFAVPVLLTSTESVGGGTGSISTVVKASVVVETEIIGVLVLGTLLSGPLLPQPEREKIVETKSKVSKS